MPRTLAAVAALGVLVVVAAALLDDRESAFTVGLPPVRIAAELQPGERACRTDIDVPAEFSRVRLFAASFGRPGLDHEIASSKRIEVCVTNDGDSRVALRGSPPDTAPPYLGDPKLEPELGVAFLRDEPSSMAALVPEAFARASLFRPDWVGAWTFWALLVLVVAGVPVLLMAAYRSAVTDST
jgi:hypothetical protein